MYGMEQSTTFANLHIYGNSINQKRPINYLLRYCIVNYTFNSVSVYYFVCSYLCYCCQLCIVLFYRILMQHVRS